jgi:hypothetical protein
MGDAGHQAKEAHMTRVLITVVAVVALATSAHPASAANVSEIMIVKRVDAASTGGFLWEPPPRLRYEGSPH